MAWTGFTDDSRRGWKINRIGLWILVRQNLYNKAILRHSQVKRVKHFFGPDEVSVETDFPAVTAERDRLSSPLYTQLERDSMQNGARILDRLTEMRRETELCASEVMRMKRAASHELYRNIEKSVHRGEVGKDVAGGVRDLSSTVLVVTSGIVSGGAALALLGGGSILRGVGSYEDKGSIGGAILTATGTFVVGLIPLRIGGKVGLGSALTQRLEVEPIKYGERAALVIVGSAIDAQVTACNAFIDGRSGREALRKALVSFGADLLAGGLGTGLDRWALPVWTRIVSDSLTGAAGGAIVDREPDEKRSPPMATARSAATITLPTASMPAPTNPAVCDANAVLSTGQCGAQDWVRQVVMQPV